MLAQATVAVLLYHSVAPTTTRGFAPWTIDPSLFEEHLAALREARVQVIPAREVPEALVRGQHAVAISIDDGLADVVSYAAPTLLRHGLPTALFVPTAYVGGRSQWLPGGDGRRPMLSWDDLGELARGGFEIGSHGRLHLAADVNPVALVRRDAVASKAELEDRLGVAVESFAYPFGYQTAQARRAIREAGYAQAFTVGDLPACGQDDRWALPRLQVSGRTGADALLAMIRWRPSCAARSWAHAKQDVWRAGRRLVGWGPEAAGPIGGPGR